MELIMGYTRILTIDGGGIRGIIPAQILVVLEKMLQKYSNRQDASIGDYFDLIAGTSTGGILTSIYLCPDKNNPSKTKFRAKDAVSLYCENGNDIFSNSIIRKFLTLFGILRPTYSPKQLEATLDKYFEGTRLSELYKPCLITSYDIKKHSTVFFNKLSAIKSDNHDFLIKDVARATSSAPTYFPVAKINSINQLDYSLIDGGVFANNPALCAYAEASKLDGNPTIEDMLILSLGTGAFSSEYDYKKAKTWGKIKWVIPLINILMSGESETVDYQLKTLFKSINKPDNYLRINPSLRGYGNGVYEMDNACKDNIELLKKIGFDTANSYFYELDRFSRLLVSNNLK